MPHPLKPQCVIFDWDNTLVDSWPIIHRAMNMTLEKWGMPTWSIEDVKNRIRHSMRDAFPVLFGDDWKEAGEVYRGYFRQLHINNLQPLDGAKAVLDALKAKGILAAILSNKTGEILRLECTHLGWNDYFAAIVGSSDYSADKPSHIPVDGIRERLNITAETPTWFVGDSIVDVECARNTGCIPVFYGDHFHYDGGRVELQPGEWHAPNHQSMLAWLNA